MNCSGAEKQSKSYKEVQKKYINMKHQEVNVDFWAMGKAMLTYGLLTAMVWVMLKLFNNVFTMPRRLRAQQENIQNSLQELQKRFPDLNITEEDLQNAEKDLEELLKEDEKDREEKLDNKPGDKPEEKKEIEESKKSI